MKNSTIPTLRPHRIFRVFANYVKQSLNGAHAHRFRVLRHEKDMAALLFPNLVDKLRETLGASQIQDAAGFTAVPVSTGDDQALPAISQLYDSIILFPATHGIDLERVQESYVPLQKLIENLRVALLSQAT